MRHQIIRFSGRTNIVTILERKIKKLDREDDDEKEEEEEEEFVLRV